MEYLIFLLMTVIWNFGSVKAYKGCTPTMYLEKFPNKTLTIPVESLSIDKSKIHQIHWQVNMLQSSSPYRCTYNEEGYEIKIFQETLTKMQRLNYLNITGISSDFKPKVACNRISDAEDASNPNTFYYLGEYKGTWHLKERHSFLDPRFFLYVHPFHYRPFNGEHWYLGAVGKYYPCPLEGSDEYNSIAVSFRHGKGTGLWVLKNVQFEVSWIHSYLSRPPLEWRHSNILTLMIERSLHMAPDKFSYEIQLYEHGYGETLGLIRNNRCTLGENINVDVGFQFGDLHWDGDMRPSKSDWHKLIEYGFPTEDHPFGALGKSGMKQPILDAISDPGSLDLSVYHGLIEGNIHHDTEIYRVGASGTFSKDPQKMPPELLRGLYFGLLAKGKHLENGTIIFEHNSKCHNNEGPMREKLRTLWKRMRDAIPKEKYADIYIKETQVTNPGGIVYKCESGKFKLEKIEFTDPKWDYNHFLITLSWHETGEDGVDTLYSCRSYMLLADFIKILLTPGV